MFEFGKCAILLGIRDEILDLLLYLVICCFSWLHRDSEYVRPVRLHKLVFCYSFM